MGGDSPAASEAGQHVGETGIVGHDQVLGLYRAFDYRSRGSHRPRSLWGSYFPETGPTPPVPPVSALDQMGYWVPLSVECNFGLSCR
jgi:hypothetical protein